MARSKLSLKWLEVFESVSRTGSIQEAATDLELSVSTASNHLLNLEKALGVPLLEHARRPMVLTPAGTVFLREIEEALRIIRGAESKVTSGNITHARDLRLGLIEDFESEVVPELVHVFASLMPNCSFRHFTRPSHEILTMLGSGKIDAGVATRPPHGVSGLMEYPLLRDPFVVASPKSHAASAKDLLTGKSDLPLLRYSQDQIMGSQIEAQLRRLRMTPPNRFELESNQSILGIVAEGNGWAITTPTCFARAKRFHDKIILRPFPDKGFSRTLSLFTADTYVLPTAELVLMALRQSIERLVVTPLTAQIPWLSGAYRVLANPEISDRVS